jgi:hypothetical protein
MGRYTTPQRYRLSGDGLTTPTDTSIQDYELEELISRSEATIDAYMGFPLRHPSGFAPGILGIVQSGFNFSTRKCTLPMPAVPARNVTRLRVHISNVGSSLPYSNNSAVAQGLYAILDPAEIVLNNDEGYGETISLTLTYSMSAVIWELGLNPPILEFDIEMGYYLPFLGRGLYNTTGDLMYYRAHDGHWASTYTMAPSILPNILPPVPPLIYKNGAIINATLLTAPLTAGVAYTNLSVAPLLAGASAGTSFTLNGSTGPIPGAIVPSLTVTLSSTVSAGATSLPVNSVTPVASYPAAVIPAWWNAGQTTQNSLWGGYMNGTYLTQGCSIDYNEGSVSFYNSGTPAAPVANAFGDAVQADFTGTIPKLVHEAVTAQVSYLMQQRKLNQLGAGGLELVKSGEQSIRRAKADDAMEDSLCARARLKLVRYASIAIG